jgi:hypothetical protein
MMRKGFVVAVAAVSFGLGAWLSPRLTAQDAERYSVPVALKAGQGVSQSPPAGATCQIEEVAHQWVRCQGGEWRNLETGYGFRIHGSKK